MDLPLGTLGTSYLEPTQEYVYTGSSACSNRVAVESFVEESLDGVGIGIGCKTGPGGAVFFETVVVSPPPRRQLEGRLRWLPDDSPDTSSPVELFQSPDLLGVLGVNSTAAIVKLGADIVAIDLVTGEETMVAFDPGWLGAIASSAATQTHVYAQTADALRIVRLVDGLVISPGMPIDRLPVADTERMVWRDPASPTRIRAASEEGEDPEVVVETEGLVLDLALGPDALYWLAPAGLVYRLPYPESG
jgi:hypothetical protein